jgi:large subunit ribosomal protein L29
MKAAELRTQVDVELRKKVKTLRDELFWLKFKLASGQLDKPAKICQTRRDLARLLTVLNEKRKKSS